MRILRRLTVSLLIVLLIAALLLAGLYAPAKLFEFMDRSESSRIHHQELDAVDLTLTVSGTLFERMNLLRTSESSVSYDPGKTVSTVDDISISLLLFLDTMCWYADTEMPDVINNTLVQPLQYHSKDGKQSVVFWECFVQFPDEGIELTLLVDDITRTVVGLYIKDLHDYLEHSAWTSVKISHAVRETLNTTLAVEIPVWTDDRNESTPHQELSLGYQQCTLTIREGDDYYRYTMCMTDHAVAFNHPICGDLKARYGNSSDPAEREEDVS